MQKQKVNKKGFALWKDVNNFIAKIKSGNTNSQYTSHLNNKKAYLHKIGDQKQTKLQNTNDKFLAERVKL